MLAAYNVDSGPFLVQLWFAWEELCENRFKCLDFEFFSQKKCNILES